MTHRPPPDLRRYESNPSGKKIWQQVRQKGTRVLSGERRAGRPKIKYVLTTKSLRPFGSTSPGEIIDRVHRAGITDFSIRKAPTGEWDLIAWEWGPVTNPTSNVVQYEPQYLIDGLKATVTMWEDQVGAATFYRLRINTIEADWARDYWLFREVPGRFPERRSEIYGLVQIHPNGIEVWRSGTGMPGRFIATNDLGEDEFYIVGMWDGEMGWFSGLPPRWAGASSGPFSTDRMTHLDWMEGVAWVDSSLPVENRTYPNPKHTPVPDTAFDLEQLQMGTRVEMEHTDDPRLAREIAKDHLAEIPDYYTRLLRMEREAGVEVDENAKRIPCSKGCGRFLVVTGAKGASRKKWTCPRCKRRAREEFERRHPQENPEENLGAYEYGFDVGASSLWSTQPIPSEEELERRWQEKKWFGRKVSTRERKRLLEGFAAGKKAAWEQQWRMEQVERMRGPPSKRFTGNIGFTEAVAATAIGSTIGATAAYMLSKKLEKNPTRKKHIVSWSGGKDSTAMLLRMLELDQPVDIVLFADTGHEFPEMYEFVALMDEWLYQNHGLYVTVASYSDDPTNSFLDWFYGKITRGKRVGQERGMPLTAFHCYWSRESKSKTMLPYTEGNYVYIGIAADEAGRAVDVPKIEAKYPLVEWGWTEADALAYLDEKGWGELNPLFHRFPRTGCWFCPKQCIASLRTLWKHYPELWSKLKELERASASGFAPGKDLTALERRFREENGAPAAPTVAETNPCGCCDWWGEEEDG